MEPEKETLQDITSGWSAKLKEAQESGEVKTTKGVGRPRASSRASGAASSAPSISFDGKELQPLVKAIGNTTCRIAGVSVLDATEIEELTEAFAPVLSKYAGNSLDRWGAEIALGVIVLKVSMPRVSEASAKRKERKEAANRENDEIHLEDDF